MQNVLLLRFDELEAATRPADEIGNLDDLIIEAGITMPAVVDAAVGRGRRFVAATPNGLRAQDKVPGTTLLARSCSIQAILNWQLAAQSAYGSFGTIYARGKGTAAAEYISAALELRVVNAALNIGELRWLWMDTAGNLKTQVGAQFQPSATEYLMLTATRRWVSSSEVVLRYFLGDMLIGEVTSVDGDIGGGTTGTTSIGTRFRAAWDRFFDGTIDELRVLDYELADEEIAGTWNRITKHQPAGYQLLKELHDPGFPISADPSSRAQKETRLWGNALGYASAQGENLRNIVPTRSYGPVLEDWEDTTKQAPKPNDSTDTRQARVVARLRRTDGVSVPGVGAAVKELVATDPSNLEIIAFDQTLTETWATLDTLRWQPDPSADWTIAAGALRVQAAAGNFRFEDTTWKKNRFVIGGNGRAARILSKVTPTTLPANAEVGVFLEDDAHRNVSLLGLRFEGGVHKIMYEEFRGGVSTGAAVQLANLGAGMPANVWLHLYSKATIAFGDPPDLDTFRAAYSVTSGLAGFIESADLTHKGSHQWAGLYMRGNVAGAVDAKFDDTIIRAPCGTRSFKLYLYRNPALAGTPDVVGVKHILRQLKQAHTHATFITTKSVKCDDNTTVCDDAPIGGF